MSAHAQLSPSSADRWMSCPGSVRMCEGIEDAGSSAANEGTMLHEEAARVLEKDSFVSNLSAEQGQSVDKYVQVVRDIHKQVGGQLLVEQRLPIGFLTGEEGAHGTADAVILGLDELVIADAKFGRGVVVEAENNKQLMIYALAAYDQYKVAYDFKVARLVIVQPRLNAVLEWTVTIEQLEAFSIDLMIAAQKTQEEDAALVPNPKACQWCRAKANCPAIREVVIQDFDSVVPETAEPDDLARVMTNASMIESWVKAVRAEVERRLLAGVAVTGYKLVKGKRGNRKWASDEVAEETLKAMRVKHDQRYSYSLVSPTTIEKLAIAEKIGPRQWKKIQEMITQSEGTPSVAPVSDKRPALDLAADVSDFDDVSN